MINLMPSDVRAEILYARKNTKLLGWLVRSLLATTCIFVLSFGGVLFINSSIANKTKQNTALENQLKDQGLEETQKRIQAFTGNLKLVNSVLSKEILFSKLLQQIGAAMPSGTVLSGLTIQSTDKGIDFIAIARDKTAASQVQINLKDPKNRVFEEVDIVKITCGNGIETNQSTNYPCTGNYRALFNKQNQFLFIHDPKVGVENE